MDSIEGDVAALDIMRSALNAYSASVNAQIGRSHVTPYRAFGEVLRLNAMLEGVDRPEFSNAGYERWSPQDYEERRSSIDVWQRALRQSGSPRENIFWGCEVSITTPSTPSEIRRLSSKALSALHSSVSHAAQLSELLEFVPVPARLGEIEALTDWASALHLLSGVQSSCLDTDKWIQFGLERNSILSAAASLESTDTVRQIVTDEKAFVECEFGQLTATVREAGGTYLRLFNGKYRAAESRLKALLPDLPKNRTERLVVLQEGI